jgi:hypothetical protein
MSCTIYCLAPSPDQVDTVVDRVKDAGVDTDCIVVVPRRSWRMPSATRAALFGGAADVTGATTGTPAAVATGTTGPPLPRRGRREPPVLADCLMSGWFAPAAWWWELTVEATREAMTAAPAAAAPAGTAAAANNAEIPATKLSTERYAAAWRRRGQ